MVFNTPLRQKDQVGGRQRLF